MFRPLFQINSTQKVVTQAVSRAKCYASYELLLCGICRLYRFESFECSEANYVRRILPYCCDLTYYMNQSKIGNELMATVTYLQPRSSETCHREPNIYVVSSSIRTETARPFSILNST